MNDAPKYPGYGSDMRLVCIIQFPHYTMPPVPITEDERIQAAMLCTNIFPAPPPKSPLDKMLETLEWENSHSWLYRIMHWRENPKYRT